VTESAGRPSGLTEFFFSDEAAGLVEYALIIAVVAISVIVAMIFLRGQLSNIFSNIGNNVCRGANQTGACP
jgi:Flp pilus assembly pilin Flp